MMKIVHGYDAIRRKNDRHEEVLNDVDVLWSFVIMYEIFIYPNLFYTYV